MREIKFRTYDKEEKVMYLPDKMYENKAHYDVPTNMLIIDVLDAYMNTKDELFTERFVLDEFTGLKDKNGVEIYEGDIVKGTCRTGVNIFNHQGMVTYYNGSFILKNLHPQFDIDDCDPLSAYNYGLKHLGNIHENPELLEGEDADR